MDSSQWEQSTIASHFKLQWAEGRPAAAFMHVAAQICPVDQTGSSVQKGMALIT